ncbi:ABC transporter permease [Arthrobacter globiformis]|uniref:ABC transporter permease n=1 Tax=Arthrobacter globiformis TaxID=1665 RepID=UPI0027D7A19B|nr:ABC transporter permease [Arthrobacter globiformis]
MVSTITKARPKPGPARSRPGPAAFLTRYGVIVFLILLVTIFALLMPRTFPTAGNLMAIVADQSIPIILALAAILPLAAGEFDLSIAAVLGFSSILSIALSNAGMPLPLVLAGTLIFGLLVGAVNAFFVVKIGINAFIGTLAMATILAGLNLLLTRGSLMTLESEEFARLTSVPGSRIQIVITYALVLVLVIWYLLERTPFGRYLRATGMGRPAARLSGVRTERYLTSSFVLAALLASFAGFLLASRSGSAPPTLGPEFLLPAYAAAFLGAATIRPGFFNVWGTVVGAFLLAVGSNGLTLMGAQTWVANVFNGVALLAAVSAWVIVARRGVNGRT